MVAGPRVRRYRTTNSASASSSDRVGVGAARSSTQRVGELVPAPRAADDDALELGVHHQVGHLEPLLLGPPRGNVARISLRVIWFPPASRSPTNPANRSRRWVSRSRLRYMKALAWCTRFAVTCRTSRMSCAATKCHVGRNDVQPQDPPVVTRRLHLVVRPATGEPQPDGPPGHGVLLRLHGDEGRHHGGGIGQRGPDEELVREPQPTEVGEGEPSRHVTVARARNSSRAYSLPVDDLGDRRPPPAPRRRGRRRGARSRAARGPVPGSRRRRREPIRAWTTA